MHGAKDHFDPTPPPLRLVGGPDDYDALAELFLGGESRASRKVGSLSPQQDVIIGSADDVTDEAANSPQVVVRPPSKARASEPQRTGERLITIEALILGHLPVRSSPWVAQYARARADQLRRPVCLLRAHSDNATIDVFGASAPPPAAGDLETALGQVRRNVRDWIIQVDELTEPTLAADDRLSAITILTSANEAAVIAAYRAIKGLASAPHESTDSAGHCGGGPLHSRESDDDEHPELRVGIMGATPAEAQAAMARLRNACSVFLGKPLELAASVERVAPAPSASVYRGPLSMNLPRILAELSAPPRAPDSFESESSEIAPETPAATIPVSQPAEVATSTDSLASHLSGLRPLAARWPDDESIELAVDERGRLNLLRRADAQDSCQRLLAAMGWAIRHAELIALTVPTGAPIDTRSQPVGRLFVSQPKEFRTLLDSDVRLHLLAQPAPGAPWLCLELN